MISTLLFHPCAFLPFLSYVTERLQRANSNETHYHKNGFALSLVLTFWKWEFCGIGDGLLTALLPTKPDASEEIYCKWQIYRFATNPYVSQATTTMNLKKTIALLQSSLPSFLTRLNSPPRPSPPSQTHSTKVNRELKQQRLRRLRKRHLKSEVALFQTLSRLIASSSVRQRLAIFTGVEF